MGGGVLGRVLKLKCVVMSGDSLFVSLKFGRREGLPRAERPWAEGPWTALGGRPKVDAAKKPESFPDEAKREPEVKRDCRFPGFLEEHLIGTKEDQTTVTMPEESRNSPIMSCLSDNPRILRKQLID